MTTSVEIKAVLPSLEPAIDHCVKCHLIHQITCPQCYLYYIGQTDKCLEELLAQMPITAGRETPKEL